MPWLEPQFFLPRPRAAPVSKARADPTGLLATNGRHARRPGRWPLPEEHSAMTIVLKSRYPLQDFLVENRATGYALWPTRSNIGQSIQLRAKFENRIAARRGLGRFAKPYQPRKVTARLRRHRYRPGKN